MNAPSAEASRVKPMTRRSVSFPVSFLHRLKRFGVIGYHYLEVFGYYVHVRENDRVLLNFGDRGFMFSVSRLWV